MASVADFATCDLSDALIKLGSAHGGLIADVQLVSPSDASVRIAGPAYTVRLVYASDTDAPRPTEHFLDAAPSGSIVVIAAPDGAKNAVWGGLLTAAAQARGVRGVVIAGRTRDVAEHVAAGFPVFARGLSTVGQTPFVRAADAGTSVTIAPPLPLGDGPDAFPAVHVVSGQSWIVADRDGVICVPADQLDAVLAQAARARDLDAQLMADLVAGRGVGESFRKWRG